MNLIADMVIGIWMGKKLLRIGNANNRKRQTLSHASCDFFVFWLMVRFCKEWYLKKLLLIVLSLFLIVGCSKNGKHTEYYDNGQKYGEVTYKAGVLDGLLMKWDNSGLKYLEEVYKENELISQKCWNQDGKEVQCP